MKLAVFVAGLLCFISQCRSSPECPVVRCRNGQVSGIVTRANHEDAKYVFNYNSIPFAEAPVGNLRFQRTSILREKWNGVLNGSIPKNGPLSEESLSSNAFLEAFLPPKSEHNYTYSEDCLNLNIYTTTVNRSANLPVVVWLYGGGFGIGNNQQFDGTALAGLENVVVVIPNYRVNVFGFTSFGAKSILPGNVGLHDQYLAFKWVKHNIQRFGGDPNNILAFGVSAGSVSVGHQLYAPRFKGLFHKAIHFSGVASTLLTLISEDDRIKKTQRLFEKLGVTASTEADILQEMQAVDAMDVVRAVKELQAEGVIFYPVVNGRIIKKDPNVVLENGDFNKVPSIVINTDNEGMGIMGMFIPGFANGLSEDLVKFAITHMLTAFKPNSNFDVMYDKIKERLFKYYPNDQFFYSKLYGRVFGEIYFHYPSFMHALKLSEFTNTYMAMGAYQLKLFHDPSFGDGLPMKPEWVNCDHGEDIFMTLGVPFIDAKYKFNPKFRDEEKLLSLKYMRFIANFARNGDPNDNGMNAWKPFSAEDSNVMKIGLKDMILEKNIHQEIVDFWNQEFISN